MPKIPLSQKAGLVQHQTSTVPMSGAPDMDFNMGSGRQLEAAGRGIAQLGAQARRAIKDFQAKEQATQDRLMATEAENLFNKMNLELDGRMKENPAQYENFADWAEKSDADYRAEVEQYTSKMSPEFRAQFEVTMQGNRDRAILQRANIGMQAKVTADYNLFQYQFNQAATAGNYEAVKQMIAEHRGTLISDAEAQQKMLDYDRLSQSGQARREVDANSPTIIADLQKRTPDGSYANFPAMQETYRQRLINYAQGQDAERRSNENQVLLDQMLSGEVVTEKMIDEKFKDQTSPEAIKQKNIQKRMVRSFQAEQEAAKRRDQLAQSAAQREKQAAERQKQNTERERFKRQIEKNEYDIMAFKFSDDPSQRQKQYNNVRDQIFADYAGQGPIVKRLLGQLDAAVKAVTNPDSSYKNSFVYLNAMAKLDTMQGDFDAYEEAGDWSRSGNETVKLANFKLMKLKLDEYLRNNPNATLENANKFIDNTKKFITEQQISDLMSAWGKVGTQKTATKKEQTNGNK